MSDLTVVTFDWVPELPRGYVRDVRIRWALEEIGVPYRVTGVSFEERDSDHFGSQPFGQVPWLIDGEQTVFESGAILLYLAENYPVLMHEAKEKRTRVIEWVFAALNSVEAASLPWSLYQFSEDTTQTPGRQMIEGFLQSRLQHMNDVLSEREWLVDDFSVADILMADVLRLVNRFSGMDDYSSCQQYLARAIARPAFQNALADQLAFYQQADEARS